MKKLTKKLNIKKIASNKKIMYIVTYLVTIILCLVLNITFSMFVKNNKQQYANIVVGDLKYKMVINEENNINSSVGEKNTRTNVIGDRILKLLPGKKEYFFIDLTSLNNINTKYEVLYKVCANTNNECDTNNYTEDNNCCKEFVNDVETLSKIKVKKGTSNTYGTIGKNDQLTIAISTTNNTGSTQYILAYLNVGYSHNNLEPINQITGTGSGIVPNLNIKDLEVKTVVNYLNGSVGNEFPDDDDYNTEVYCHHPGEETPSATGVLEYQYYDDNTVSNQQGKWKLNVSGIESGGTLCEVTFTEGKNPASFATDSWSTIKKNITSDVYQLGDTKCVSIANLDNPNNADIEATCKANNEFTLRLVNKSSPSECNSDTFSQTACGFVVAFESPLPIGSSIAGTFDSTSGYANSAKETYLNSSFLERLPEILQNSIIDTKVVSGGKANVVYTTTDKIYLASVYEMESISTTDPAQTYTRPFDYIVSHQKESKNGLGFNTRTCYTATGNSDGRIYCNTWMYMYQSDYTYKWERMAYAPTAVYGYILPFFRIGT